MDQLEHEANLYARSALIDESAYEKFVKEEPKNATQILEFSKRYNIHPGIVVGRLQRDGAIGYNQHNDLRVKYDTR
jgi:L-rhamnose isomerase